jgi:centrosomal protein CEP290
VLKDELAQAHVKAGMPVEKPSKHHHDHHQHQAMEQTILTLKRVIEKLKVENKYLKESKPSSIPSTATYMSQNDRKKEELFEKLRNEHEKLQKNHNEMLGKVSALEIELQLSQAQAINVSCPHCNRNFGEMATQDADVLSQQLQQKTLLLEKAKTLLTRAAAKEKHLREQIFHLKKRVCDLEGVPVISEENSESG